MRDAFMQKGMSEDAAQAKAARIYNSKHPDNPVGPHSDNKKGKHDRGNKDKDR